MRTRTAISTFLATNCFQIEIPTGLNLALVGPRGPRIIGVTTSTPKIAIIYGYVLRRAAGKAAAGWLELGQPGAARCPSVSSGLPVEPGQPGAARCPSVAPAWRWSRASLVLPGVLG